MLRSASGVRLPRETERRLEMKRLGAMKAKNAAEDKVEAWALRVVVVAGLIGPVTLIAILLWIAHWDATQSSHLVHQQYLPSAYVNTVAAAERSIDIF
jgi:hypothetical protein